MYGPTFQRGPRMRFSAIELPTANEALQEADASGYEVVIRCQGRFFATWEEEADRLAAAGVQFACLMDHESPDGIRQVLTVPVNRPPQRTHLSGFAADGES